MISGGPDSVALLAGLVRVVGPGSAIAIHLDYRLRSDSDRDRATCEMVCRELGVEMVVERPDRPDGGPGANVHDWARRERYGAAEEVRQAHDLDWIAVGHTSTDLAETVLYRLASSPGTRAMAAMPTRRGHVVRPLLALDRATTRRAAVESGLPFVDDPSNADPSFARSRIRGEVLPVLEAINPGTVGNIARTRAEVEQESDLAGLLAGNLLSKDREERSVIPATDLIAAHPAVARHAIRMLAETATGGIVPVSIERTAVIQRLCGEPEGGAVDLGAGVVVLVESGVVTAARVGVVEPVPDPVFLESPGQAGWGKWHLSAEVLNGPVRPRGPEVATLDAAALPDRLEVRGWSQGDRIQPLGMQGSKPVADLLAEHGVGRTSRPVHPVVVAGDEVVWVPGVAVTERLRIGPETPEVVLLTADRPDGTAAP